MIETSVRKQAVERYREHSRASRTDEAWQIIPSAEQYEASESGQIWDRVKCRVLKQRVGRHGYIEISVRVGHMPGSVQKTCRVHQLVLEAFVGLCPPNYVTRHLDGVRSNNRLSNLRWGTQKENCADRLLHGTDHRGEKSPIALLTNAEALAVVDIRRYLGWCDLRIGRFFGVSSGVIHNVLTGKSWGWLTDVAIDSGVAIEKAGGDDCLRECYLRCHSPWARLRPRAIQSRRA